MVPNSDFDLPMNNNLTFSSEAVNTGSGKKTAWDYKLQQIQRQNRLVASNLGSLKTGLHDRLSTADDSQSLAIRRALDVVDALEALLSSALVIGGVN